MEDVLDVYQRPYNPKRPVVNMDEHLVQLVKETRTPEPAHPGKPKRYEYERNERGSFSCLLSHWRVGVRFR